jgi:hypothetical protein
MFYTYAISGKFPVRGCEFEHFPEMAYESNTFPWWDMNNYDHFPWWDKNNTFSWDGICIKHFSCDGIWIQCFPVMGYEYMYNFYPWWEVWILLFLCANTFSCHGICPRENIVFIYRHRRNVLYISHLRKKYYFYPITENDHNYSYPITGKYSIHMPSQENVQIHNPSREIFIFISRTGNCSCSYPITGK